MIVSRRINQITALLLETREALTIKEIAIRLKLSERTVYREMDDVRALIESYDLELLNLTNKGIFLQGTSHSIEALRNALAQELTGEDFRIEERIELEVLKLLMEPSYIKLQVLSSVLKVSLSTIKKDQSQVKEFLAKGNLLLESKMGEGIKVQGYLYHRHIAVMDILTKNLDVSFLLPWLENKIEDQSMFLTMIENEQKASYKEAYKIIDSYLAAYKKGLSDIEIIEFSILLGCWYYDMKNHTNLVFDEKINAVGPIEEQIFSKILDSLSITEMGDNWIQYLKWIIQIYFGNKDLAVSEPLNDLSRKINQFVENIENRMGVTLLDNSELIIGLQKHIAKAMNRIVSGIAIRNPLEKEIRKDYASLYQIVLESAEITFGKDFFPSDEIGYLVLYFAVALDKMVNKSFRVLIVCSSGMGSAKMLSSRLEREIPELYVKKITSLVELGEMNIREYELILSTVPLFLDDNEYMQVSPLLNAKEIEIIRTKIENHKYRSLNVIQKEKRQKTEFRKENSIKSLRALKDCSEIALKLIDNFESIDAIRQVGNDDADDIVKILLSESVIEAEDKKKIKERWDENYYKVPNKDFSILVCPVKCTDNVGISIITLTGITKINEVIQPLKVIVIRHPMQENQKVTALLSSLIISLTTDEETNTILHSHNQELIIQFVADQLRKLLIELF